MDERQTATAESYLRSGGRVGGGSSSGSTPGLALELVLRCAKDAVAARKNVTVVTAWRSASSAPTTVH